MNCDPPAVGRHSRGLDTFVRLFVSSVFFTSKQVEGQIVVKFQQENDMGNERQILELVRHSRGGTSVQPTDTDVALVMEFEPRYDPGKALLISASFSVGVVVVLFLVYRVLRGHWKRKGRTTQKERKHEG